MILVGILLVAPDEHIRLAENGGKQIRGALIRIGRQRLFRLGIVNTGETGFLPIGLSCDPVYPDVVRLEEGPELVILLLRERIVLVVVTPGALQGNSEKRSGYRLDGVLQPDVAIKPEPIANQ